MPEQTTESICYFREAAVRPEIASWLRGAATSASPVPPEFLELPLQCSYNWAYSVERPRLARLYALGKELNWNADRDVHWDQERLPRSGDAGTPPLLGLPDFARLGERERALFDWHTFCWSISQFLHGEQGALLVASQLVSSTPSYEAKLYAASQTFDEARHVEVFQGYIERRCGIRYPISSSLRRILDRILLDPRWDLKLVGMQIVIEGLALAAFHTLRAVALDPVLRDILDLVIRDESRHVGFGVQYLADVVDGLAPDEREERAAFAYEACVVGLERLIPTDVYREFGWDVEAARRIVSADPLIVHFREQLVGRVLPNLERVHLLTPGVRPRWEQLLELDARGHTSGGGGRERLARLLERADEPA